jgi:acyl transferase domain-containing protein
MLSLADATELSLARGRLMQALPDGGTMVALEADAAEVEPLLGERVSIAAVNGQRATVLSGDEDAVSAVVAGFPERRSNRLWTSHAFHSYRMDPMVAELRAVAQKLTYAEPLIPMVSNLTGAPVEHLDAEYWVRQARSTVRFADGVAWLRSQGVTRFVEIGPDGVLSALASGGVPVLRRDRTDGVAVMEALARLYAGGVRVDWDAVFAGVGQVELPTYPFQRQRYWQDSRDRTAERMWSILDSADIDAPLSSVLPSLAALRGSSPPADEPPGPGEPATLRQRLALLPGDDQLGVLLDLVLTHTATVLGHEQVAAIEADQEFLDVGFASLTAMELRNRLAATSGVDLPPTLIYDYPTPAAVADHLRVQLEMVANGQ